MAGRFLLHSPVTSMNFRSICCAILAAGSLSGAGMIIRSGWLRVRWSSSIQ